jgi:hypothetical protein
MLASDLWISPGVDASDEDIAGCWRGERTSETKQGALPRTILADHTNDLTGRDVK